MGRGGLNDMTFFQCIRYLNMTKSKTDKHLICLILTAIFCMSLSIPHSFATTDKKREITIVIPAEVLASFVNDVLPVQITNDRKFSGAIWVKSIDKLELGIDKVSFSVNVHGEDITYTGNIGNLPASLSFGSVDASFNCEASIRYDKENSILYVRPQIVEKRNRNEVLWPLLVALIGNKEYPVQIQRLKPLIAKFSNKSVIIRMHISNIYTTKNRLFIEIRPGVEDR